MDHREHRLRRSYWAIAGLLVWFGLVLQLYIIVAANIENNTSVVLGIVKFFSYFTILSNLFVALAFTMPLVAPLSQLGTFFSRTSVRTAIATYILVTGIVYVAVLRQIWDPQGLQLIADVILHYATPLLYIGSWLFLEHRGHLKWVNVLPWLLFPLGYFGYSLIRGALSGTYPYPFVDVDELGLSRVLVNALVLIGFFTGLSLLLIGSDQIISRWAKRPKPLKRFDSDR